MRLQNHEVKNAEIRRKFEQIKATNPGRLKQRLNLSWSNWGFGQERFSDSVKRLAGVGIQFIELHGNHHGADLGYKPEETRAVLADCNVKVGGICGIFSPDHDLSSNRAVHRQNAIDYVKRELEFAAEVGAEYFLVVPGAVGRPNPYDNAEFERSVESLQRVADRFVKHGVKAAIEPIRSAEVSFCSTIAEVKRYIAAVDHPGVRHINGDVFHMQTEENHIGMALLEAGDQLLNLHLADSNRGALGSGSMDLDTIIMALYVLGCNRPGYYATPEPLGPGGAPYAAMFGKPDPASLDVLVQSSLSYFRERESHLLG